MYKIILMSALITYSMASSGDYGNGGNGGDVIPAAVKTKYSVEVKNVDIPSEPINPQTISVGSQGVPIKFVFNSASTPIKLVQQHQGSAPQSQETESEDEPDRLKHTVTKPIIQDVREIIIPYRRVTQQVKPVVEEIKTIIARGKGNNNGGSGSKTNHKG